MKKGILFDLDGTLWDSSKEVAESWLLAAEGYPALKKKLTVENIQAVMGKPMNEIEEILFVDVPEKQRKEVLAHCMKVENEYIEAHGGKLFEGLREVLTKLKREYHLYIVSNCQKGYIEAFLKYHKLGEYFDDYECFGATKKPKGDNIKLVIGRNKLEKAVYLGDTQGDFEATVSAGLPFIHARMGYGKVEADVPYIHKLGELPEMVSRLLGDC